MKWREALVGLVATLIIWQVLALLLNTYVFPPPTRVLVVFFESILGDLGRHFLVSAWRVVAAILAAVLLAVPIGLGLGQTPVLNRLFSPLIYIVHPIPKIVFLPIILILLGAGDTQQNIYYRHHSLLSNIGGRSG